MFEGSQATPGPLPYALAADDGEAVWFLDTLMLVKATGEQTGGAFALVEQLLPRGHVTPLHVQPREDETFYLLEGQMSVRLGERTVAASAGAVVFVARGTPHALRVESETARCLVLDVPAGHERFFLAVGRPAASRTLPPPPEGPPDMRRLTAAANGAGFEILGPPPF